MGDSIIGKSRVVNSKFLENRSPIIGVDLDNVCFPHTRELRSYAADWIAAHKRPGTTIDDLVEDAGWFAPEWDITPDEFFAIERYAIERGFFRDANPIEGAAETLQALAAKGFVVRYVTARPQHHDASQQTRDSLARHGFPNPDHVLFVGDHFGSHLKSMLNYSLYIDDSVSNIHDFESTGIPFIVFDQVYNRELGDRPRVLHWSEVPQLVEDLLVRTVVPPDRSRELHRVEDQCIMLGKRAEDICDRIATLTEQQSELHKQKRLREVKAVKLQLEVAEGELLRVERSLNQAERRRQALLDDVLAFDEYVRQNPEHMREPKLKEYLKLRDETHAALRQLAAERAELEHAQITAAQGPAILIPPDQSRYTPREIISYGPYIQTTPEGGQLLDALAMLVARAHVQTAWNDQVIGSRVVVRIDDKTTTDIDLLVLRSGKERAIAERSELLSELSQLFPDDLRHHEVVRLVRALERKIFVAVEVKNGLGGLSTAQKTLHRQLSSGGTTTIATKDSSLGPDADALGLHHGTVIAASPYMLNVTSTDVLALASKNETLQAEINQLLRQIEDAIPQAPVTASEHLIARGAAESAPRSARPESNGSSAGRTESGHMLEIGRSFGPSTRPTSN